MPNPVVRRTRALIRQGLAGLVPAGPAVSPTTKFLRGDGTWAVPGGGGGGSGDFSGASSSVVGEIVVFGDTTGKLGARATGTGIAKVTAGVLSVATPGTDYATATTVTTQAARVLNMIALGGAL